MKNRIATAASTTKNFVATHKYAVAMTIYATAATAVAGALAAACTAQAEFIEEKGLDEEFHTSLES